MLIKTFKEIAEKSDVRLVFVGGNDYFYKRLKSDVIGQTVDKKIIFLEKVNDEKLSSLYSNAVCLVRPSLMEGFSLPPLEAIRFNCLVIASDIPVHREIFKDNLLYFDPNDYVD